MNILRKICERLKPKGNISRDVCEDYTAVSVDDFPHITADCFIPVGAACRPAFWIKKCGLRYCSLPFDWMMSFSLQTVLHLLQDDFSSWFDNYVEDESKKSSKKRYVKDVGNQIISMHGFPVEQSVEEYMPEFKATFLRRGARMKNILATSERVCFVCNRSDKIKVLLLFATGIAQMFPNLQVYLLNIRNSDGERKITEYKTMDRAIVYDVEANDIHEEGNDKSNPKSWLGNEELWNEICADLSLTTSKNASQRP